MIRILTVPLMIAAIAALGDSRSAQKEARSFIFVEKGDSGGGETFTRSGGLLSGDMMIGKNHAHYEGRIAADGTIPRLDIHAWRSDSGAQASRRMSVIVGRDGAQLIERVGGKSDTTRLASAAGAIPVINPSMGLLEVVVARARSEMSQKSRSAKVPILFIDALYLDPPATPSLRSRAGPGTVDITFISTDTVRLGYGTSKDQMRIAIGADGGIRSAASGPTAKDRFAALPTSKRR